MRRFRIVGALEFDAEDMPAACKSADRLQELLDRVGVELQVERVEGITADVVPLHQVGDR